MLLNKNLPKNGHLQKLVLLDAGFFIGRQSRHWGPKGTLRRAYRRYIEAPKGGKPNPYMFTKKCRSTFFNDLSYIDMRMVQMRCSPKFKNSRVILCYDGTKGRQLRGITLPSYKENRLYKKSETSESYDASEYTTHDFRDDISKLGVNPAIPRRGWEGLYIETCEADDLIGILTQEAFSVPEIEEITIYSQDSDILQLMGWDCPEEKSLRFHDFVKQIEPFSVEESLGIPLDLYPEFKSLAGDTSDNIPGIPNMGPKKAAKLLTKYGGITDIPNELLIRYHPVPAKVENIAKELAKYQDDNSFSDYGVNKTYGSAFKALKASVERNLMHEEYIRFCEDDETKILDKSWFNKIDYAPLVLDYLKIIKIPHAELTPLISP